MFHLQYLKIIQNPSNVEIQKAANQGRRCTWEKLAVIKANFGIELALDECVAVLNHMRRIKRTARRAAAAASTSVSVSSSSQHPLPVGPTRFSASRRIPSWNCIARENSAGSVDDDVLAEAALLYQQLVVHRGGNCNSSHDGDSPEAGDWTRSGGPLERTTSAQMFMDYVQNLDGADPGVDLNGDASSRSITVAEGDYLQTGRTHNGFVLNLVRGERLRRNNQDVEDRQNVDEAPECVQLDSPEKDIHRGSSASEEGDAEVESETVVDTNLSHHE